MYDFILSNLAKISRKKKEGPSRKLFLNNYELLKINNLNSFDKEIKIDISSNIKKIENNLDDFINENLIVKDKEVLISNNMKYLHYVIEIGKHKFHDDLEIIISKKKIKLRSSSRVGVLDNGVNNNRINFILNNINLHS